MTCLINPLTKPNKKKSFHFSHVGDYFDIMWVSKTGNECLLFLGQSNLEFRQKSE